MKKFLSLLLALFIAQSLWASELKVVSLVPSQTELLCAMGFKSNIAAISDYCNYPKEITNLPRVGGIDLNLERIIALKPFAVIDVNSMHRRYEPVFKKLGINYISFEITKISQISQMAAELAAILKEPQKGRRFAAEFDAALKQIRLLRPLKKQKVYIEIFNKPMQAAGGSSFMGDFLKEAGGENIIKSAEDYPLVNSELIIKANPDIIILCYPNDSSENIAERPGFCALSAVKQNRVYKADHDIFVRPSPRNLEALRFLSKILNEIN